MENEEDKISQIIDKIDKSMKEVNLKNTELLKQNTLYVNFDKWLIQNGAIFKENLNYPVSFGKQRIIGITCNKTIIPNTALFYIPNKLIIDSSKLLDGPYKYLTKIDEMPTESNTLIISIFLLDEYINKEQKSFWKPYIDLINIDSPLLWTEDLLTQLEDDRMIESILEFKNDLLQYYKCLIKYNIFKERETENNKPSFNFQVFIKFYSFVTSRNFLINNKQALLIPFADSLNHSHVDVRYECYDSVNYISKYATDFDEDVELQKTNHDIIYNILPVTNNDTNTIEEISNIRINEDEETQTIFNDTDYFLIATGSKQTYNINEQVYNFYGRYSNEYLLKWYGFCYLNNKYDKININLHLPKSSEGNTSDNEDLDSDPMFEKYLSTLFKDYYTDNYTHFTMKFALKQKHLNIGVFNYIRFYYFYENDEIDKYLNYLLDLNVEIEVINRTIQLLEVSFKNKNNNFSLKEDVRMLELLYDQEGGEESTCIFRSRLINILILRISQKRIILLHIKLCKIVKDILELLLNENSKTVTESVEYYFDNNKDKVDTYDRKRIEVYINHIRKYKTNFD